MKRQIELIMIELGIDHFKAERSSEKIMSLLEENAKPGMTEKEKQLASYMLELASHEFSNHGCNDVEAAAWEGWTMEERKQFIKDYHQWNDGGAEYEENDTYLPDWAIMAFLADKLNVNDGQ